MVWSIVSSRSCFCRLCRASPSLDAKNIINLILVLMMSTCRVVSCIVGRVCLLWPVCSLGKTVSFCLASFYTPRPHLPVTPGYLLTSNFCIPVPYDEKDIFFFFLVLVLEGLVGLQRIIPSSASSALVVGAQTWITVMLNALSWKQTEIIL